MTNMPLRASVVIPHWNARHYLPACLDSLLAQTYRPLEVLVVDNASEDGSQELVKECYPTVQLIELPDNRGFTGACNAGMVAAKGEVIVLLNNDTEAEPDWIEQIMAAFSRHADAGIVASKMLLFDKRDTLHTSGDGVRIDGIPYNRGIWQADGPEFSREEYVFSACGGSAAYRKSMLDRIGLLDDDFYFSLEDVDIAWRAQLAGFRCVYAPGAVVYHHLSATGGGKTASFYTARNLIWLVAKNVPMELLIRHGRHILSAQARRLREALWHWRGEAAQATLAGMVAGLVSLPKALQKRRAVQKSRVVTIEYLESMLTPIG